MPAVSKKQRIAMAIAEHHPEQLYARNKGMAAMSQQQLHDFAATPEKGLPRKASNAKSAGRGGGNPQPNRYGRLMRGR